VVVNINDFLDVSAEYWAPRIDDYIMRIKDSKYAKQYLKEHGLMLVQNPKYLTPEEIEHIVMPYGRDVDPYECYRGDYY
jgi:hypothetical protein